LESAFRKISRVRGLTGGTKWYLSEDCLLSAKLNMYAVEYRRFYLRDLESVIVWPSRLWLLRVIIPAAVLALIGALLWRLDSTAGEVFVGLAIVWVLLELALGPTANSRLRTTGLSVDLPLVTRVRRGPKVLAKIDAAVRASRVGNNQQSASGIVSQPSESLIAPADQTNAS
jgi:hypothetical protein